MSDNIFLPILIGNGINAYGMARAFHEEYDSLSIMLTTERDGITQSGLTNILACVIEHNLNNESVFISSLSRIMAEYGRDRKLILIPCNNTFARYVSRNKDMLLGMGFVIPCPGSNILEQVTIKENLYNLCTKCDVTYPKTYVYNMLENYDVNLEFPYPVVVSASDESSYVKYFPNETKKAYLIHNKDELVKCLKLMYSKGYPGNTIIQEVIPGDDSFLYNMMVYVGSNHKVRLVNLSNTILKERNEDGVGDNVATLTVYNMDLMLLVSRMFETINYEGFVEVVIKLDPRDRKYKVLKVNTHQGSTNYRVTGGGENLAKYLVNDYIKHFDKQRLLVKDSFLWHEVPVGLVYTFIKDDSKHNLIRRLVSNGLSCSTSAYKKDMPFRKWIYLRIKAFKAYINFLKYYPR